MKETKYRCDWHHVVTTGTDPVQCGETTTEDPDRPENGWTLLEVPTDRTSINVDRLHVCPAHTAHLRERFGRDDE